MGSIGVDGARGGLLEEEGSVLAHGGGYGDTGPVWVASVLVVQGERC